MRLCLVEDLAVCALEPLTLTRPVHELLLARPRSRARLRVPWEWEPGPQRRSCLIRSHLVEVQRQRDPHMVVNDRDWLARGPVVVANGRWVPPVGFEMPDELGRGSAFAVASRPVRGSGPTTPSGSSLWASIRGSSG